MTNAEPVLFEATLQPSPPMAPKGLCLALALLASVNLVFAIGFVLRGAWPVTPFMGLDVLLLAWAFRTSTRASRRHERVVLTRSKLFVERHPPAGPPSRLTLNPYWVRLEMDDPPGHWSHLTLWSHGQGVRLGAFLAPAQRRELALALKAALKRSRETIPE